MNINELLEEARKEGVGDPDNLPFLRHPALSGDAAVLLVHGFTATPWEMSLVAESLQQTGFSCLAIRLPGHGTTPEDLAHKSREMWQAETNRGVQLLKQNFSRVYGVGLSSGSLLLLEPAARGELAGMALLSPYLNLGHWLASLTGILRFFVRYQQRKIADEATRHYYAKRPVAGIYQLRRLIRQAKVLLPDITVPTMVLSAQGDQTIAADSAHELYRLLGSQAKSFHEYGMNVPHVLTTSDNPHLEDSLARVSGFLAGLESGYKAQQPTP